MLDYRRLMLERLEMEKLGAIFPGLRSFELCQDTDYEVGDWRRYFWHGTAPTGHIVVARYSEKHPSIKMNMEVIPDVNTRHKHGKYLCYLKDGEWSANWTAATAILTAFRFLKDYVSGTMD